MSLDMMLLAAQAGGYASSLYARKQQERIARKGDEMDRQQLQLQLQQEQLASTEQSFYNTEKLRDVMATQRALFAARGQQAGQGSNFMIGQASQRAYNAEESARQLSMSFRKHQLESKQRLIGLNRTARNAERRAKDIGEAWDMLSYGALSEFLSGSSDPTKINIKKTTKFS